VDSHAGRVRPLPGSLTIERAPDSPGVLRLVGDIDSAVVAEFEGRQGRRPVVVGAIDAGAVTFLGSAGLAVMVRYAEAAAGVGRLPVLRAASAPVDRLLRAAGLEDYFPRHRGTPPAGQNETGSSSTP
jgi:anti-anti-sigma factor